MCASQILRFFWIALCSMKLLETIYYVFQKYDKSNCSNLDSDEWTFNINIYYWSFQSYIWLRDLLNVLPFPAFVA